jgi:hypothetical protein
MKNGLRRLLLGRPVAGALAFGATQAIAAPRMSCVPVTGACPRDAPCGQYCSSGIGTCHPSETCCMCVF